MNLYIWTYEYTCIYIHVYIYINLYVYMYFYKRTYIYVNMHIYICTYILVYTGIFTYIVLLWIYADIIRKDSSIAGRKGGKKGVALYVKTITYNIKSYTSQGADLMLTMRSSYFERRWAMDSCNSLFSLITACKSVCVPAHRHTCGWWRVCTR